MRKSFGRTAAILCALGTASASAVAGNSSLAPLTLAMPVGYCALRRLLPTLLLLAIAGGIVPAVAAGQNARPDTPAGVAGATATQVAPQKYDRVIGVCHLSANPYVPQSAVNSMSVAEEAIWYLKKVDRLQIEGQATVSVLQMPAHGKLLDGGKGNYAYLPEEGYLGNDRATLVVEVGGKKVRMEYFFRVMTTVFEGEGADPYADNCPEKIDVWKISTIIDTNGNKFIAAVNIQSPTETAAGATACRAQ